MKFKIIILPQTKTILNQSKPKIYFQGLLIIFKIVNKFQIINFSQIKKLPLTKTIFKPITSNKIFKTTYFKFPITEIFYLLAPIIIFKQINFKFPNKIINLSYNNNSFLTNKCLQITKISKCGLLKHFYLYKFLLMLILIIIMNYFINKILKYFIT